jgi:pyridoxine 4-dehydrogenase
VATKCGQARRAAASGSRSDGPSTSGSRRKSRCGGCASTTSACCSCTGSTPQVPPAEQVAALARLREEGKVARIGLSEVSVAQLEEARAVTPIESVQNR